MAGYPDCFGKMTNKRCKEADKGTCRYAYDCIKESSRSHISMHSSSPTVRRK